MPRQLARAASGETAPATRGANAPTYVGVSQAFAKAAPPLGSARHAGQTSARPPGQDRHAAQENRQTSMSSDGGSDCNRNCAATRNQLAPLSGRRAAYGDSGRGAERHRTRNLLLWPRRPVVRQCAGVIGKTGGLAAGHGTLEWSLGFVTRDSPNGFVCSSSPRGITPQPSPCLTRNAAKTIAVGGRAQRALKRAILHRKNSMFTRTVKGARVGDIYMSLIHTCALCKVNPFEYLQALHTPAQVVMTGAAQGLPWNYREQLARPA